MRSTASSMRENFVAYDRRTWRAGAATPKSAPGTIATPVLASTSMHAEELSEIAPPVYIEVAVGLLAEVPYISAAPAGLVVELTEPLTDETLAALRDIADQRPLWLGPGLHPELARDLVNQLPLAGLVFPSGDEVKPGLRDFDQLEAVFEALEVE